MQTVGIIGAGAWGTALAMTARRAGRDVVIWALESQVADGINRDHVNHLYLPGVALDPAIAATGDLERVAALDLVLLVPPAQHLRATADSLGPFLRRGAPVVICAKGIEQGTAALMTEAAAALDHTTVMVLSGPSFAVEVARGLPTALTLATTDLVRGRTVAEAIRSRSFRPYLSSDVIGTQIGGAVKNVLAITVASARVGVWARTRVPPCSPAALPKSCALRWHAAAGRRRWQGCRDWVISS